MKMYRLLYGTGSDGTYGTLSEDPELRRFLLRDIGADSHRSVINRTMGVFGAFQALADYGRYDRDDQPVMIRYAPMYLRVFPEMPADIRPFCIVGASGNEGRSRDSTYTQMDFFTMEQLRDDPKNSYLDYILGIQAFDRQDVDRIRSGKTTMPAPVPQKIIPSMRSQDKEHVLKAVSALFDRKLVVIRLEPGASFVSRAREILAQIYSLLPISYAAQVGYSIYQSPGTIQEIAKYWSFRIFVVPAEEYVDSANPNFQFIDMAFSEWNNSSELNRTLKSLWELSWEKRLRLLKSLPSVYNREEFLEVCRPLMEAVVDLDQWCSDPPAGSVKSLTDLQRIFEEHPQWKQIPWANDSVKECLPSILQPGLTIERLNARAYAARYAQGQPDPQIEDLLKLGQLFGSIDQEALCVHVDEHAYHRAKEEVRQELEDLQRKNQTLDSELKDKSMELVDTTSELQDTRIKLNRANTTIKADREKLNGVFALVEPAVEGIQTTASWEMLSFRVNDLLADREQMKKSNDYLRQLQIDPTSPDAPVKIGELNCCSEKLVQANEYLSRVGIWPEDAERAQMRIRKIEEEQHLLETCQNQFRNSGKAVTDLGSQIGTLLQIEQVLAENGIHTASAADVRTELNNQVYKLAEAEKALSAKTQSLNIIGEELGFSCEEKDLQKMIARIGRFKKKVSVLDDIRNGLALPVETRVEEIAEKVCDLQAKHEEVTKQYNQEVGFTKQLREKLNSEKALRLKETELLKQWAEDKIPEDWADVWNNLADENASSTPEEDSGDAAGTNGNAENDPEIEATGIRLILEKIRRCFSGRQAGAAEQDIKKVILAVLPWALTAILGVTLLVMFLRGCDSTEPDKNDLTSTTAASSEVNVPQTTAPAESTAPETTAPVTTIPAESTGSENNADANSDSGNAETSTNTASVQPMVSVDPSEAVLRKAAFEDWEKKPYGEMRSALEVSREELKFERDKRDEFFTQKDCGLIPEVVFALDADPDPKKPYAVLLRPEKGSTRFALPDDAGAIICCGSNVIAVCGGSDAGADNSDELTMTAIRFMRALLDDGQPQIQPVVYWLKDSNGVWIENGAKILELTKDPDWFNNIEGFTTEAKACEALMEEYKLPAAPMLSVKSKDWIIMIVEGGHDADSFKAVGGTHTDCDGLTILYKELDKDTD